MESSHLTTVIVPASHFYEAESYHQKYLLQRHPELMKLLGFKRGPELAHNYIATKINGYVGGHGTMAAMLEEVKRSHISEDAKKYLIENYKIFGL